MSTPSGGTDQLFQSLDPLVRRGTISPSQADEVYRAVSARAGSGAPARTAEPAEAGWHRPRLLAGLAVFGGILVMAAFSIASSVSEGGVSETLEGAEQDFSWKPFLIMAAISLFFVGLAAVSHWLFGSRPYSLLLTGFFGTLALFTVTSTIEVPWDSDALVYLGGALLLVGGIVCFWYFKAQLFTVAAFFGGLIILLQIFSDVFDIEGDDTGFLLTIAMLLLGYGIAVTAAGWTFSCRNLTTMLGGAVALAGMYVVVLVDGVLFIIVSAFGGPSATGGFDVDDMRTDMRIAMFVGLFVALALVAAYVYTSYVGFLVLAFVGAVPLPVAAITLLGTEHPLRWAIAFGFVGGLAAAAQQLVQWRESATAGSQAGHYPPPHDYPPPQDYSPPQDYPPRQQYPPPQ